jgi:hypothetical protein
MLSWLPHNTSLNTYLPTALDWRRSGRYTYLLEIGPIISNMIGRSDTRTLQCITAFTIRTVRALMLYIVLYIYLYTSYRAYMRPVILVRFFKDFIQDLNKIWFLFFIKSMNIQRPSPQKKTVQTLSKPSKHESSTPMSTKNKQSKPLANPPSMNLQRPCPQKKKQSKP